MKVVISIPAYNEERTIGKVIDEINRVMKNSKYRYSILVLNDGSRDMTATIAKKHGAKVVSNKRNMGLAETFNREMEECLKLNPDVIVHTDADGQYPATYIPGMIEMIEHGNDLVLGSRFRKGIYNGSFTKKLGNIAFAFVLSQLLNKKLSDTTTGFRAFTPEIAKLPLINDFTYTQEQLIRASRLKMRIAELPINARTTRESRLFKSTGSYAVKAWVNILRIYRDYAPLKFFGAFGIFLFIVGLLLGLLVIYNILTTGSAGGIPRVILSALSLITGIQIWFFGLLADMIKKK